MKCEGILLIGPTGAGKTPLGEYFERRGFDGRACHHFDFGACLRMVADGAGGFDLLPESDREFVRGVLKSGALLENEKFYIAENILKSFIDARCGDEKDIVVLNGLPRHAGQADAIDGIIDVVMVVYLDCEADVVLDRIRLNSGGDRAGRSDDSVVEVRRKLELFRERTMPLLDHYRRKSVNIERIVINSGSLPDDVFRVISKNTIIGGHNGD